MGQPQGGWNAPYQPTPPPIPPKTSNVIWWVLGGLGVLGLVCGGVLLFGFLSIRSAIKEQQPVRPVVDAETTQCISIGDSGDYAAAIPHCRAAVEAQPNDALAHNNLGRFLALGGHADEAVKECKIAIRISPTTDYYDSLAMAQALNGQGKESQESQKIAMKDTSGDPGRFISQGMTAYAVGDKKGAKQKWNQVIEEGTPSEMRLAKELMAKYR